MPVVIPAAVVVWMPIMVAVPAVVAMPIAVAMPIPVGGRAVIHRLRAICDRRDPAVRNPAAMPATDIVPAIPMIARRIADADTDTDTDVKSS